MSSESTDNTVQYESGLIKWYNSKKGFGFIDREDGSEAFFHISDLSDEEEAPPCDKDRVKFYVQSSEDPNKISAKDVRREWHHRGVITGVKYKKGFGFIRHGAGEEATFFHFNHIKNAKTIPPRKGQYVAFSNRIKSDKGFSATSVKIIEKNFGVVAKWENGNGQILPLNSDNPVSVYWKDIIRSQKDSYRSLEVGENVSFLWGSPAKDKAICVRWDYEIRAFAVIGNEEKMLEDLAENKALKEDWSYSNSPTGSSYRILWNYLAHTFHKLKEEDTSQPLEKKKIKISGYEERPDIAVFDTGLVDKQYKPLYAVFTENTPANTGKPKWTLVGFCARGEKLNGVSYLTHFRKLPERAEYFDEPSDLLYNYKLRLDAVTDHIVGDRGHRLPESIRKQVPEDMDENQMVEFLSRFLMMATDRALERIKWNYKAAIPQYYEKTKKIQLLLPLCIDDPRKVDLALAVQRENKAYVGYTILELDWAYNNARLIARPDSDWLTPTKIQEEESEEESEEK